MANRKPPAKPKAEKPHSLSDSDIVSKPSVGRMSPARGTDTDSSAGKVAKASDRDAASGSEKPAARTPPEQRTANDKDHD